MIVAALRVVLRLPFIACLLFAAPFIFGLGFAMGDSPREAAQMVRDMLRAIAFGRLP